MHNDLRTLIREYVSSLISERRRKRQKRHKPGGPRTDAGALRQLQPEKFTDMVRSAVVNADGDVATAADDVGVAPRTLYHYLDDEPRLRNVKTVSELPPDASDEE
jgi:hypothetical protein